MSRSLTLKKPSNKTTDGSISKNQTSVTFQDENSKKFPIVNSLAKSPSQKKRIGGHQSSLGTRSKSLKKGAKNENNVRIHKTVKMDFNELQKEIFTPDKIFKHNVNWRAILKNSAYEMKQNGNTCAQRLNFDPYPRKQI
jgi:hypothetical protein